MEPAAHTTSGTTVPSQEGGFPPFKSQTFVSQYFWLTITFAFLFVVLWRFAGPRIQGAIAERRGRINSELAAAEQNRRRAEAAQAEYQAPLIEARERARGATDDTRAKFAQEAESAKAAADKEAEAVTAKAEERIAALRAEARRHIADVAKDAVIDIVNRLTGETVSAQEAAAAVQDAVKG
jgi:F-type H+-transporting ATPase subunit b